MHSESKIRRSHYYVNTCSCEKTFIHVCYVVVFVVFIFFSIRGEMLGTSPRPLSVPHPEYGCCTQLDHRWRKDNFICVYTSSRLCLVSDTQRQTVTPSRGNLGNKSYHSAPGATQTQRMFV